MTQQHYLKTCHHPCSSVHNSKEMGTTRMSVNWWRQIENVVHMHNGLLFNGKEGLFVGKYTKLENIMLCEGTQTQRENTHILQHFLLLPFLWIVKFYHFKCRIYHNDIESDLFDKNAAKTMWWLFVWYNIYITYI